MHIFSKQMFLQFKVFFQNCKKNSNKSVEKSGQIYKRNAMSSKHVLELGP